VRTSCSCTVHTAKGGEGKEKKGRGNNEERDERKRRIMMKGGKMKTRRRGGRRELIVEIVNTQIALNDEAIYALK